MRRCLRLLLAPLWLLASAASLVAQPRPTLRVADYARWETIGSSELSPDGRWLAYGITRVAGDAELRVHLVSSDSLFVERFATNPVFSSDGRWLAYSIGVSEAEADRLQKAGEPVRMKLGLVDLRTGEKHTIGDVAAFEFSADAAFLAMRSADVLTIRSLATQHDISFGNVSAFAWRDVGALLALVIDAPANAGNGVRVFDPRTGVIRSLVSDTSSYASPLWHGDDLAVLRVRTDSVHAVPAHALHIWRGADGERPVHATFDPAARASFPQDYRIAESRPLRWSADGRSIFFGIRSWEKTVAPDTASERAGVAVWHARDVEIVPERTMRAGIESSRTDLSVWHVGNDRWVRLGDDVIDDVTAFEGRFAIGADGSPYDRDRMFGPVYRDLYAIDIATGARTRFAERVEYSYSVSPGGRYMLYVRDDAYWTYDAHTGRHTNITAKVPARFINDRYDQGGEAKPPYGNGSWTTGDRSVLLYDEYDVWEVTPDGSRAVNLTNGAADGIRARRYWLSPDDRVIDTTRPIYFTLYGVRTKKFGYGRRMPGARQLERLLFVDRNVSRLQKASGAEVYAYRAEAFDDSPDVFVANATLANARQVSHTNPFQNEYAWGRAELLDFNTRGNDTLQAALLYPANWEPERRYPLIVFPYEIVSNTLHTWTAPSEFVPHNPTVFTQNGYFVLRPDVLFRARDPGLSSLDAILPAVERALALGVIDSSRIGIVGHSWGAYQAAFAVTQTDRFRAAVAAAPLTDLMSMYLSVYWNTGGTDARMFEVGQARMEVPPWRDLEAYVRNSPVFQVERMNTPLLVAFGDRDGAVDWHQGIELYNAARRAGKDLVLLVYEGENHSLSRKANQRDYHQRVNQWFDHYLKGAPAPAWITGEGH